MLYLGQIISLCLAIVAFCVGVTVSYILLRTWGVTMYMKTETFKQRMLKEAKEELKEQLGSDWPDELGGHGFSVRTRDSRGRTR